MCPPILCHTPTAASRGTDTQQTGNLGFLIRWHARLSSHLWHLFVCFWLLCRSNGAVWRDSYCLDHDLHFEQNRHSAQVTAETIKGNIIPSIFFRMENRILQHDVLNWHDTMAEKVAMRNKSNIFFFISFPERKGWNDERKSESY